ncbi:hypothetical protein CERSUDRAFT_65676 [Gelatoporia subvermispora B]|uniref:Uncharacterized protein n=1 Tax=Ceriporiopsis subvermispora (strain B) TaxID=914234 RepID=M2RES3_CERS8|nr:hypothetical protein CERSUDRAFT_65676 [Gelatoporia subvermispora B]
MLKCPEFSRLPRLSSLPRSVNFKRTTPGSLSPYLGAPPTTRILDPSHPAASIPRNKVLTSFPHLRTDGFLLRAVPKALLYAPESPYPDPPYGPPAKDARKVNVSLLKIVAKRGVHKSAVIRSRVSIKFKTALSMIVTRGAHAEEDRKGRTRIVFRQEEAGKDRWTLENWTYLAHMNLELYRMPYTKLIPDLRRSLEMIRARAEKLEAQWRSLHSSRTPIVGRLQSNMRTKPQAQVQNPPARPQTRTSPQHKPGFVPTPRPAGQDRSYSEPSHVSVPRRDGRHAAEHKPLQHSTSGPSSASNTASHPNARHRGQDASSPYIRPRYVGLNTPTTLHNPSQRTSGRSYNHREYSTLQCASRASLCRLPAPLSSSISRLASSSATSPETLAAPKDAPSHQGTSAPAESALLQGAQDERAAQGPLHEMVDELLRDAAAAQRSGSGSIERMFSAATKDGPAKDPVQDAAAAPEDTVRESGEMVLGEEDEDEEAWKVQHELLLAGAGTTFAAPWHHGGVDPFAYWPAEQRRVANPHKQTKLQKAAAEEAQFPSVYDHGNVTDPVRSLRTQTSPPLGRPSPVIDNTIEARKAALELLRPTLTELIAFSKSRARTPRIVNKRVWWARRRKLIFDTWKKQALYRRMGILSHRELDDPNSRWQEELSFGLKPEVDTPTRETQSSEEQENLDSSGQKKTGIDLKPEVSTPRHETQSLENQDSCVTPASKTGAPPRPKTRQDLSAGREDSPKDDFGDGAPFDLRSPGLPPSKIPPPPPSLETSSEHTPFGFKSALPRKAESRERPRTERTRPPSGPNRVSLDFKGRQPFGLRAPPPQAEVASDELSQLATIINSDPPSSKVPQGEQSYLAQTSKPTQRKW